MTLPVDIYGIIAPAGSKVVAVLLLPAGLETLAGRTVSGGALAAPEAVPTAAAAVHLPLSPAADTPEVFGGSFAVDGPIPVLPNSPDRPYTVEVRRVNPASDTTTLAGAAAAYAAAPAYWAAQGGDASDAVVYTRDVPATLRDGTLQQLRWGQRQAIPHP